MSDHEQKFKYALNDWRECDLGVEIDTSRIILDDGHDVGIKRYTVGIKDDEGGVDWCLHSDNFDDICRQTDDAIRFLAVWMKQTHK